MKIRLSADEIAAVTNTPVQDEPPRDFTVQYTYEDSDNRDPGAEDRATLIVEVAAYWKARS